MLAVCVQIIPYNTDEMWIGSVDALDNGCLFLIVHIFFLLLGDMAITWQSTLIGKITQD